MIPQLARFGDDIRKKEWEEKELDYD